MSTQPIHDAVEANNLSLVRQLLDKGANVEAMDKWKQTPLFYACWKGHLVIVKYLVEQQGANVEAKNDVGITPVIRASAWGQVGVVRYLVEEAGANVEARDIRGRTALDMALEKRHPAVQKYLEAKMSTAINKWPRVSSNVKQLWHITSDSAASKILRSGQMLRGSSGMVGGGIYFAGSLREAKNKAKYNGSCVVANVAMGQVKHLSAPDSSISFSSLRQEGYDSVQIQTRSGIEYVVYNWDQVKVIAVTEM